MMDIKRSNEKHNFYVCEVCGIEQRDDETRWRKIRGDKDLMRELVTFDVDFDEAGLICNECYLAYYTRAAI